MAMAFRIAPNPVRLTMNIHNAVDKAYETKSMKEIAAAPVDTLQGVSAGDAELLAKAFNIKTVRDLGTNKYFRWAQAVVTLADREA
jgi:hypothetical protein